MQILNLTPHPINVYDGNELVASIPSHGEARREVYQVQVGEVTVEGRRISVWKAEYGSVVTRLEDGERSEVFDGLPAAVPGRLIVVSRLVLEAPEAAGRQDLVTTHDAVRGPNGQIVGCRAFAV